MPLYAYAIILSTKGLSAAGFTVRLPSTVPRLTDEFNYIFSCQTAWWQFAQDGRRRPAMLIKMRVSG
jgi:hypothetical protein